MEYLRISSFGFRISILASLLLCFVAPAPARAAESGSLVAVVYNSAWPGSKEVADHYAEQRQVPASQVLGLKLPETESITRAQFRDQLQEPLLQWLRHSGLFVFGPPIATNSSNALAKLNLKESKIRYLVLCYGVPLKIAEDSSLSEPAAAKLPREFRRNSAAVDSELCWLPFADQTVMLTGPMPNHFYGATNGAALTPTNGILLVARLDGPSAAIARGLVDQAIQADRDGLWGRAYFDARGLTNGDLKLGDDWMEGAADAARRLGFETVLDEKPETFPRSFPMSQIALYAGWYEGAASGPFTLPKVEFMPGAFAYHLYSYSAASVRSPNQNWVGPLLEKGVTATMGCVDEPYLTGTPNMQFFFTRWMQLGFSFGEAAYASQAMLSWQTTVVGDPLYRPFARKPQELHEYLEARRSKLIEWSHLRVVNLNLGMNAPTNELIGYLREVGATNHSAVLTEKLGELLEAQGQHDAAIESYQQALKLEPSPQQAVRLTLTLAEIMLKAGKESDALDLYDAFFKTNPDYPGLLSLYTQAETLATRLKRPDAARRYAEEIKRRSKP